MPCASHSPEIIEPWQIGPTIISGDTLLLGIRSSFSPFAALGWLSAAGYEQLINGSPNYGTDRGAFGQRLGAAAIRATTEDLLSESVFAPIFREDPRYYRLGRGHSFSARVLDSVTPPPINRTDKGNNSINFALLLRNLARSELTYPHSPNANPRHAHKPQP